METTRQQIERFLRENHALFTADGLAIREQTQADGADEDEWHGLELTIATDDGWNEWGFQTGDNSYSGACYFFPHWAVVWYYGEETADDMVEEVLGQLDDLTADVTPALDLNVVGA